MLKKLGILIGPDEELRAGNVNKAKITTSAFFT